MILSFVYIASDPRRFPHSWPGLAPASVPYLVTSLHPYISFSKSLPHNLFADPHPLNLYATIFYKNGGGGRVPSGLPGVPAFRCAVCIPIGVTGCAVCIPNGVTGPADVRTRLSKSFSCNTYGPPRKCCKQKTYFKGKPFRCNTYEKQGVHPSSQIFLSVLAPLACSCPPSHLPYTLPSSVSRKSFACHSYENCRGVYQQFPFWDSPHSFTDRIPFLQSVCFHGLP